MKILIIGAGVIGTVYAWKLSESGNDVSLLVRPGKKAAVERDGFLISCRDERKKQQTPEPVLFRPTIVETYTPESGYDLIIVAVRSHQVEDILPDLAKNAGAADILFFQNNWWGDEHIRKFLPELQYLFGFSRLVGGWKNDHHIECIIFDSPMMATLLGERCGVISPRLQKLSTLFQQADLKPHISRDILGWLATHYIEFLGAVGAILKAGSARQFAHDDELIKEAVLATREGLDICRARGIDLAHAASFNLRLYNAPLFMILPLARWQFNMPSIQQFFDENIAHGMEELSSQYFDVLGEGKRLGVKTPHLEAFQDAFRLHCVEGEPVHVS